MKILIEIDDEVGEELDALAKDEHRSRAAQARHLLTRAIHNEVAEREEEETA